MSHQSNDADSRARRILLVDDSDELRELYEVALTDGGYDVRAVPLAESALEIAAQWRPDLVLTDLFMPGMGGLELITRLRSDLTPPVPPVVAISGFPDARDEALRRGATRFEIKPIGHDELLRLVDDVIEHRRRPRRRDPKSIALRRGAARTLGEAMLVRYLADHPKAFATMGRNLHVAARFFGFSSGLLFVLREGALRVSATSDPRYPVGATADDTLPILNDVVESAGSIILQKDVAKRILRRPGGPKLAFLVALPYVIGNEVVGVLCFTDEHARTFDAPSLGTLEYFARRAAATVRGEGTSITHPSGLFDHGAFIALLTGSLRLASEARHALGVMVLETAPLPSDGSLNPILDDLPEGVMIGVLDSVHVGAFTIAHAIDHVPEQMARLREHVESRLAVRAVAELTYDDRCVPPITPEALLVHASELIGVVAMGDGESARARFMAIDARRRPSPDQARRSEPAGARRGRSGAVDRRRTLATAGPHQNDRQAWANRRSIHPVLVSRERADRRTLRLGPRLGNVLHTHRVGCAHGRASSAARREGSSPSPCTSR